jgi:hypothetical protein
MPIAQMFSYALECSGFIAVYTCEVAIIGGYGSKDILRQYDYLQWYRREWLNAGFSATIYFLAQTLYETSTYLSQVDMQAYVTGVGRLPADLLAGHRGLV